MYSTDWALSIYLLITLVLLVFRWSAVNNPWHALSFRMASFFLIYFLIEIDNKQNSRFWNFLHLFYPLAFLAYLYPETADFNHIFFHNFDSNIVFFEEKFLGGDFSLKFAQLLPYKIINEWFSMGYFSFYFMIFGTAYYFYQNKREKTTEIIFLIITSFYFYYLLFILIPVVGPQYYYPSPLNKVGDGYLFSHLVKIVQELGERPTGAFPSSHVGITTLLLIIGYKNNKKLFYSLLFFAIPLFPATIYLKAHYLTDIVAAFIFAPVFYLISKRIYQKITLKLQMERTI